MEAIVKTKALRKYYGTGENRVKALDGVDLHIQRGEFVAIVGTSGSGKTTLLHMIGGLDTPTSGTVMVGGRELSGMKDDDRTVYRRRQIGFVFQNFNLVPMLSVYENITLPLDLDAAHVDQGFLTDVVESLHLRTKLDSYPSALSGGQQQRVAIARAILTKPSLLLADEPTGNLDSKTSNEVLGLMKMSARKYNQTMVMITHDMEIAQLADRIVRIEDGCIVSGGAL